MGFLPGLLKSHHSSAIVKYPGSFITPKPGALNPGHTSIKTPQAPPSSANVAVEAPDPNMIPPSDVASEDAGTPQVPLDPNERRAPLPPLYQLNGDDDEESPPVIFLIPYDSGMNAMPTCPQGLMCSCIQTDMLTILSALEDARRLTFSDFL